VRVCVYKLNEYSLFLMPMFVELDPQKIRTMYINYMMYSNYCVRVCLYMLNEYSLSRMPMFVRLDTHQYTPRCPCCHCRHTMAHCCTITIRCAGVPRKCQFLLPSVPLLGEPPPTT
jgi:hypothetical protein